MKAKKPKPIVVIIGLPPWSRTRFEFYVTYRQMTEAQFRMYEKGAVANGWKHVQRATVQPVVPENARRRHGSATV